MTALPANRVAVAAARSGPPATLRRIDWRFLLPRPAVGPFQHLVLLGGSLDLAELLRRVGLARQVATALDPKSRTDAVVVLSDATGSLDDAAKALAPGGVLYCEIDRRRVRQLTPARVRNRLRGAGLRVAATYWVVPGFDPALRFIPLDNMRAARWFLRDVYNRASLGRTAASHLARAATVFGSAPLATVARCFSVVAVREVAAGSHDPDVRPIDLAVPHVPPGSSVALVTSGQDDGSRVVILPFERAHATPAFAVKIPRHARYNDRTIGEHETLVALQKLVGEPLTSSLPRPLTLGMAGGIAVASETCATGPTLLVSSGRRFASVRRRVSDLKRTADWLAAFNQASRVGTIDWSEAGRRQWLERPLYSFRQAFGSYAHRDRLWATLQAAAVRCDGVSVPIVFQHNDLGPWNVHRQGRHVTVIDWEVEGGSPFSRRGLPLMDLIYFATHWLYTALRARTPEAQLEVFSEFVSGRRGNACVRAAWATLEAHADRLAIDRQLIPVIATLTWIEHATDRIYRRRDDLTASPDRVLSQYLRYIDIISDHREAFFQRGDRA